MFPRFWNNYRRFNDQMRTSVQICLGVFLDDTIRCVSVVALTAKFKYSDATDTQNIREFVELPNSIYIDNCDKSNDRKCFCKIPQFDSAISLFTKHHTRVSQGRLQLFNIGVARSHNLQLVSLNNRFVTSINSEGLRSGK